MKLPKNQTTQEIYDTYGLDYLMLSRSYWRTIAGFLAITLFILFTILAMVGVLFFDPFVTTLEQRFTVISFVSVIFVAEFVFLVFQGVKAAKISSKEQAIRKAKNSVVKA